MERVADLDRVGASPGRHGGRVRDAEDGDRVVAVAEIVGRLDGPGRRQERPGADGDPAVVEDPGRAHGPGVGEVHRRDRGRRDGVDVAARRGVAAHREVEHVRAADSRQRQTGEGVTGGIDVEDVGLAQARVARQGRGAGRPAVDVEGVVPRAAGQRGPADRGERERGGPGRQGGAGQGECLVGRRGRVVDDDVVVAAAAGQRDPAARPGRDVEGVGARVAGQAHGRDVGERAVADGAPVAVFQSHRAGRQNEANGPRHLEAVRPAAVDDRVVARADGDRLDARPEVDRVVARAGGDRVAARPARDRVATRADGDGVVPRPPDNGVVTVPRRDDRRREDARQVDLVVARAAVGHDRRDVRVSLLQRVPVGVEDGLSLGGVVEILNVHRLVTDQRVRGIDMNNFEIFVIVGGVAGGPVGGVRPHVQGQSTVVGLSRELGVLGEGVLEGEQRDRVDDLLLVVERAGINVGVELEGEVARDVEQPEGVDVPVAVADFVVDLGGAELAVVVGVAERRLDVGEDAPLDAPGGDLQRQRGAGDDVAVEGDVRAVVGPDVEPVGEVLGDDRRALALVPLRLDDPRRVVAEREVEVGRDAAPQRRRQRPGDREDLPVVEAEDQVLHVEHEQIDRLAHQQAEDRFRRVVAQQRENQREVGGVVQAGREALGRAGRARGVDLAHRVGRPVAAAGEKGVEARRRGRRPEAGAEVEVAEVDDDVAAVGRDAVDDRVNRVVRLQEGRGLAVAEQPGEVHERDVVARQVGEDRQAGLQDVHDRLQRVDRVLDLRRDRRDEVREERPQVHAHVAELDIEIRGMDAVHADADPPAEVEARRHRREHRA